MDHFDELNRSTAKGMREHGIKCVSKTFVDLGHADNLSILDESVCKIKIKNFLEVLRVLCNGNEKIDQSGKIHLPR